MGSIERFKSGISTGTTDGTIPWPTHGAGRTVASSRWTQDDVAHLLASIYPPLSGLPGDQSGLRHQLSSAFLAGVAQAHEESAGELPGSMAASSVRVGRALLKNRAATQPDRVWHAFTSGLRVGRGPTAPWVVPEPHQAPAALKLFIRQPLTESCHAEQALIASVLERIAQADGAPHAFDYLTGRNAESADTFRASFEADSGEAFTPHAFRTRRLKLLEQADAFVNIRVGMSESSAFELAYHVFRGACTPVLFLVWKHAPIKTTLLKELDRLCDVTYLRFEHADDLRDGIGEFFRHFAPRRSATRPALSLAADC